MFGVGGVFNQNNQKLYENCKISNFVQKWWKTEWDTGRQAKFLGNGESN